MLYPGCEVRKHICYLSVKNVDLHLAPLDRQDFGSTFLICGSCTDPSKVASELTGGNAETASSAWPVYPLFFHCDSECLNLYFLVSEDDGSAIPILEITIAQIARRTP